MSEKLTRNDRDRQKIPKMERHYSVFCSEVQSWLTEIGHKDYSSRKAVLKKEIPDYVRPEAPIYFAP